MTDGWQLIAAERAALARDLEHLDVAGWRAGSLCEGLTVEEVVAHLTAGASLAFPRWFAGVLRCRFDFDRMVVMRLREQLGDTPEETLTRFRGVITSRTAPNRRDVGAWLGEVVVHGEDIRRPLGLQHEYPTEALLRVAEFYARRTSPCRRSGGQPACGSRRSTRRSRQARDRWCVAARSISSLRWPGGVPPWRA